MYMYVEATVTHTSIILQLCMNFPYPKITCSGYANASSRTCTCRKTRIKLEPQGREKEEVFSSTW